MTCLKLMPLLITRGSLNNIPCRTLSTASELGQPKHPPNVTTVDRDIENKTKTWRR